MPRITYRAGAQQRSGAARHIPPCAKQLNFVSRVSLQSIDCAAILPAVTRANSPGASALGLSILLGIPRHAFPSRRGITPQVTKMENNLSHAAQNRSEHGQGVGRSAQGEAHV
jgi:hypothetical protein